MGKPISNDRGFTLLEMLCAFAVISLLTALFLPSIDFKASYYWSYGDGYILKQSQAIASAAYVEYAPQGLNAVIFNPKGNVNKAMTVVFADTDRAIVVELGGGRLVYR